MSKLFYMPTRIHMVDTMEDFAKNFELKETDLILTNRFLFEPLLKHLDLPCKVILKDRFGAGEPSDIMVEAIVSEIGDYAYDRVIGIGGGAVIDIAKMLCLEHFDELVEVYDEPEKHPKTKKLMIIPATCGTGSEVTNVAVFELTKRHTKQGMNNDEIFPDDAVIIPEALDTLPYKYFLYSSADALIHAAESLLSPNASEFTKLFSARGIATILKGYKALAEQGEDYKKELYIPFLMAGAHGGISFGNAGAGAVHALSYPLGAAYHVAHGESNYRFFTAVFGMYYKKNPNGKILEFDRIAKEALGLSEEENVLEKIDEIVSKLIPKKRLSEYGMKEEDIDLFTERVINYQTRLMKNACEPLSKEEIIEIYRSRY